MLPNPKNNQDKRQSMDNVGALIGFGRIDRSLIPPLDFEQIR